MRIVGVGQVLFALSVAMLGGLSLLSGDFVLNWQPVPSWVPGREALAYASGALLVVFSLGIIVRPIARLSALVLTINFVIWLLLLKLPLVASLLDAGGWLGVGETSVMVAGAWAILVTLSNQAGPAFGTGSGSLRVLRILLGVALVLIGQSHFVYTKETIALIPAYVPHRLGFAYFTGACHIAAGAAVLFSVVPRLAATMEAVMMALFAIMVWLPKMASAPTSRFEATAFLISIALASAALAVAGTYGGPAGLPIGRADRPSATAGASRRSPS